MRAIRYTLTLLACIALIFGIGSVGAYEVGNLSSGSLVAQCVASLMALWGSVYILGRIGDSEK